MKILLTEKLRQNIAKILKRCSDMNYRSCSACTDMPIVNILIIFHKQTIVDNQNPTNANKFSIVILRIHPVLKRTTFMLA